MICLFRVGRSRLLHTFYIPSSGLRFGRLDLKLSLSVFSVFVFLFVSGAPTLEQPHARCALRPRCSFSHMAWGGSLAFAEPTLGPN